VDETTLSLNYPIRKLSDSQCLDASRPTENHPGVQRQTRLSACDWRLQLPHGLRCVTSIQVERKNGQSFIEFLEHLLVQTYPTQSVILVMDKDNASYHYSAPVRAALRLFAHRVRVFWLPQYCPELNLIERFWKHLKQTAWANKLSATIDSLRKNVVEVLRLQNDGHSSQRLTFAKNFR
jgi:transposase